MLRGSRSQSTVVIKIKNTARLGGFFYRVVPVQTDNSIVLFYFLLQSYRSCYIVKKRN